MQLIRYFNRYRKEFIYLLTCFIGLFLIHLTSNTRSEIYPLKWYYLSTPLGLLQATFGNNLELSEWLSYLHSQTPSPEQPLMTVIVVIILMILSFVFLIIKKRELSNLTITHNYEKFQK